MELDTGDLRPHSGHPTERVDGTDMLEARPHRYRWPDEDSARWRHVALRPDDIIVSTRSKHGTTLMQGILLLLIHGRRLPGRLTDLSPWVDHLTEPIEQRGQSPQQHEYSLLMP